jgi:hypothetical protein
MYIYFYSGGKDIESSKIQVFETKEEVVKVLHADFLDVFIGGYEGVPPALPDNYLSLCGWEREGLNHYFWWIEAPIGKPTDTCSHFSKWKKCTCPWNLLGY